MKQSSKRGKKPSGSRAGLLAWYRGFLLEIREICFSRKEAFILALRFFVVLGVLHLLVLTPPGKTFETWLSRNDAKTGAAVLRVFGTGTEVQNSTILSDSHAMTILEGCSAMGIWFFLVAAIVAFPSGIRPKIVGILAALALVQTLNIARIVSLFWVGGYSSQDFHMAHEGFWPNLLNLAAILLLGGWLAWTTRSEGRR